MCQAHKYYKIEIEYNRKQWITLMAAVQHLQEWFCATTHTTGILTLCMSMPQIYKKEPSKKILK